MKSIPMWQRNVRKNWEQTHVSVTNERKYFYQENNMDLFRTNEVEPYMVVQNGNMLLPVLFYMYYKLNSSRFSAGLVCRKFGS